MSYSDLEYVQEYDEVYNQNWYAWNAFYPEAETDLRYYLGDQWDNEEKRKLYEEGRTAYVINRIRREINFITGYQVQHQKSSVVKPFSDEDQLVSDQLTKSLFHVMNYGEFHRLQNQCFAGACKTGFNLLCMYKDYRADPINGDICFSREPYNGFICDPYFTRLDFSDCSNIIRRKYLSREVTESLFPKRREQIKEIHHVGWERDDKFTWLPYQRQPNGEQLMAVDEYYKMMYEPVDVVVDQETGEYREWPGSSEMLDLYLSQFPQLQKTTIQKRYIELHRYVNNEYMGTEKNPYGLDDYPFVPYLGVFEPESDLWDLKVQSLVRIQRDPQSNSNKRRSQMNDLIESQINSGWIATENSVVNPRSLFQSSQGRVIWTKEEAQPPQKIQPGQIPPSYFQLTEMYDKDIGNVIGINEAAHGEIQSANESGIMQLIRQGASIAGLQEVFENLRFSQKNATQKIIKMMQTWTPEKIKRIINQDIDPRFFDKDLTKYDIVVQEGVLTELQQQMYFRQLVDLQQMGAPVTGSMLAKAAPIAGKTEYIKELEQMEQQQAQAAQQQQQLQNRIMASQENQAQAKAISDLALSKERFTRSVANLGLEDERSSKAIQDRADSALSRIKAMKELESMDDERLLKYLSMVRMMEEINSSKEQELKEDNVNITARAQEPNLPNMANVQPQMAEMQINEMEVPYG